MTECIYLITQLRVVRCLIIHEPSEWCNVLITLRTPIKRWCQADCNMNSKGHKNLNSKPLIGRCWARVNVKHVLYTVVVMVTTKHSNKVKNFNRCCSMLCLYSHMISLLPCIRFFSSFCSFSGNNAPTLSCAIKC